MVLHLIFSAIAKFVIGKLDLLAYLDIFSVITPFRNIHKREGFTIILQIDFGTESFDFAWTMELIVFSLNQFPLKMSPNVITSHSVQEDVSVQGYHVAERSFAITLMRMLWCFDITAKEGTEIPLKNGKL